MKQTAIPCVQMRGGTSKGAYFLAEHLPMDVARRDKVLLAVMGSPDSHQIDGIGGADPLTSKVAIVARSRRPGIDVDYLFAQVVVNEARVDYGQNCGNILAGVGPFAIEHGLVRASDRQTLVSIYMVNTGQVAVARVPTPGGVVDFDGEARIDGVPGHAAPIIIDFRDTAGSTCGALLPTGRVRDTIESIDVTCIDNGMPAVILRAGDLNRSGYESREQLDGDTELKARLEAIRLVAGQRMNLGEVRHKTVPKMMLVAAPRVGGAICVRSFIPHRCHASIGVLGAVSVASACLLPGTVTEGLAVIDSGKSVQRLSVEHPSGELTVELEIEKAAEAVEVRRAALLRTARWLFDGKVYVPRAVWDGSLAGANISDMPALTSVA